MAHVNMMTDAVIANLSVDGLRVVLRSLLASKPEITSAFEHETRNYLQRTVAAGPDTAENVASLRGRQNTIRCMIGCGMCFESLALLGNLTLQGARLGLQPDSPSGEGVGKLLVAIDGDIVQTITAIEKRLMTASGARALSASEHDLLHSLYQALGDSLSQYEGSGLSYPYGRGLVATASLLRPQVAGDVAITYSSLENSRLQAMDVSMLQEAKEMFQLKGRQLPRIFSGLWQLSSPAWGAASTDQIVDQFCQHVEHGFTAFDMADHYGDAEIIFVCTKPLRNMLSL